MTILVFFDNYLALLMILLGMSILIRTTVHLSLPLLMPLSVWLLFLRIGFFILMKTAIRFTEAR